MITVDELNGKGSRDRSRNDRSRPESAQREVYFFLVHPPEVSSRCGAFHVRELGCRDGRTARAPRGRSGDQVVGRHNLPALKSRTACSSSSGVVITGSERGGELLPVRGRPPPITSHGLATCRW